MRPSWISSVICLVIVAAGLISTRPAGAQTATETFLAQQRQVEEQVRRQLDEQLPAGQKTLVDWGGWLSGYCSLWDDGRESSRTLRRTDLRLWASLNADEGIHQAYARMRMVFNNFNSGDSPFDDENDFEGPNLDRGWYRLDVTKLVAEHGSVGLPFDLAVKIGRDYVLWGTGYALSMPLDGIQISGKVGELAIDGLLARTIHSWNNLDTSRPNDDQSSRYFYGVQARYTGFERHEPFGYYLWQRDHQNDGNPLWYLQQWRYDSQYLGLGSTGELVPNWRYSAEIVYQQGRSYGHGQWRRANKIRAYGWDLQLEYLHPRRTHPKLALEYMFAGGDRDRLFSPTNAVGGNRRFTTDRGFNAFGYRDTGLALSPALSNIHIWRAGASFFPFEDQADWVSRLEAGTDWFLYCKNRARAAISDDLAVVRSGYVGWEMDYFVNWRFTSDLAWTVRYGTFFPGKAYEDKTTRTFLLTGLTWSF